VRMTHVAPRLCPGRHFGKGRASLPVGASTAPIQIPGRTRYNRVTRVMLLAPDLDWEPTRLLLPWEREAWGDVYRACYAPQADSRPQGSPLKARARYRRCEAAHWTLRQTADVTEVELTFHRLLSPIAYLAAVF
jgi:hypothetical protein